MKVFTIHTLGRQELREVLRMSENRNFLPQVFPEGSVTRHAVKGSDTQMATHHHHHHHYCLPLLRLPDANQRQCRHYLPPLGDKLLSR